MTDTSHQKTEDYKDTVFLPKTDFPMKAGLAQKEPAILAHWEKLGLYQRLREQRADASKFILHDGPPYANGDIHMGHAMNKVLKDIITRSQALMGKDAPYVPGWDCHGLPIEWMIEKAYKDKKLNKDEVPANEFRAECRAYAAKWVGVQKEQFKRLGIMGDWEDPYLTMKYEAEASIVGELLKFAESGQLYRGSKPVMWSPVEKTALAEAEVEYEDITSTQIEVAFEISDAPNAPELVGAKAVIWTTTPWTIPTNQALAFGPEIEYGLFESEDGARFVLSVERAALIAQFAGAKTIKTFSGATLAGATARHPMHAKGGFFAKPRPFLAGDFVTTDAGTGLVHLAPDHGEDDFLTCKANGIDPVFAVEPDGRYRADWAWMGGESLSVINPKLNAPEGPICTDLRDAGALLSAEAFKHSYPHSWRSKAKVIYRCTPQWFIPMDKNHNDATLRETALGAVRDTRWVPERAENRITAMVEGRPDWVISRQRAWGVPIALYVHRKSGQYLNDSAVNHRIIEAFKLGGADAWFAADHQALLGADYDLADYEVVNDILDVWFDSGSTHSFVVEARYGVGTIADLYLEGSDQHRGWFQSSLLESCGTRGRAPYKAVLTHGFALDGQGRKMSKSLGNVVDPLKILNESGADILRLWVASTDYFDDVRIGKEVLAGTSDAYRKIRNTFRYLLGALDGYSEEEAVAFDALPELERYVLHLLTQLDHELKDAALNYEFNRYARALSDFCNNDLSAFFFDIRKDCLYCDAPNDPKRRAYRHVLDLLFHALVRYAAPILCFTAEEVWQARYPSEDGSVHFLVWPEMERAWHGDSAFADKWSELRTLRTQVTEAIEPLRREKIIRSSLEADVAIPASSPFATMPGLDELFITASATAVAGDEITITKTEHHKCGRCWRLLPDVAEDGALCGRCDDVVNG